MMIKRILFLTCLLVFAGTDLIGQNDIVFDFDSGTEGWTHFGGTSSVAGGVFTYNGNIAFGGVVSAATGLNLDQKIYNKMIIVVQNISGHANWQILNYDSDDNVANNAERINFTMNTNEDGDTFSTYVLSIPYNAAVTDDLLYRVAIRSNAAPTDGSVLLNIESITLVDNSFAIEYGEEWDFDNGTQGWEVTTENTTLSQVTELGEAGVKLEWDPAVSFPQMRISGLSIDAASFPKIQVRVKNNTSVENVSANNNPQSMRIVTTTTTGQDFIPFNHSGNDTEFKTYTVDLASRTNYTGTLTTIQFQGLRNGLQGDIIIDNIRMVKDGISGSLVISDNNTVVVDTLAVTADNSIVVKSGSTLEVKGSVSNNGSITIESGGSLITYSGASFIGNGVRVERTRTFDEGRYSMIGIPIASINALDLSSPWVYSYDESTDSWLDAASTTMVAGQGYAFAGQQNLSFTGVPNTGEITYDADLNGNGYHIVANPYVSAIDASSFINAQTNITGTLYLWDDGGSNTSQRTSSDYVTVNAAGLDNDDYTIGGGGNTYEGHIGSMQAFFLQVTNTTTIKFTEEMRIYGENTDANYFRKVSDKVPYVKLKLSNAYEEVKVMTIGWDSNANDNEINPYFDSKLFDEQADYAIYSMKASETLAIQGVTDAKDQIDVGINTDLPGKYTISLDNYEYPERSLYLQDLQNGTIIDLSQKAYQFNLEEGQHLSRFKLVIDQESILSLQPALKEFYVSEGILYLKKVEPNLIRIFSLTGQQVFTYHSKGVEMVDLHGKLTKGVYIVTDGKSVNKFRIR